MAIVLERPAQRERVACESVSCSIPATVCIHWDDGSVSNFCESHADAAVSFNRSHIERVEYFS